VLFKRRHARHAPAPAGDLGASVTAVVLVEDSAGEAPVDDVRRKLRRIAAEAVIRQDEAEALLAEVRDRRPLAELAPRGGTLVSRFVALGQALPATNEPQLRRHVEVLRTVFEHHAMMVSSSLDMLAVDWRSERIVEQLERIDGLGAPAQWLEAVRADLEAAFAQHADEPA